MGTRKRASDQLSGLADASEFLYSQAADERHPTNTRAFQNSRCHGDRSPPVGTSSLASGATLLVEERLARADDARPVEELAKTGYLTQAWVIDIATKVGLPLAA